MKMKAILIIIDNLTKGGAEVMLVEILPHLHKKFEIILVTLTAENHFNQSQIICKKKYTLNITNKLSIVSCVIKLKKIIKENNPFLIHSHLFYSSLIARLACPSKIPLAYSLHSEMSKNVFNNSWLLTFAEKMTIRKNHFVLAVSNVVLNDYRNKIKRNGQSFILKNYISDEYFSKEISQKRFLNFKKIKLVAIGNLKEAKNYSYFIKVFEHLKKYNNISLDIYGRGNEEDFRSLEKEINEKNLPIALKGAAINPYKIMPQYDLYVSCSKHEGFGIAAIEATALGLPLLLSELPVYHEVTFNNALFFDIQNPMSFVSLIKEIFEGKHNLGSLSYNGINIAKKYTKKDYLHNLFDIYDEVLKHSNKSYK